MSTNYEDRGRRYNNSDDDFDRGRPTQGRGGRRMRRRRICRFCIEKVDIIDFKIRGFWETLFRNAARFCRGESPAIAPYTSECSPRRSSARAILRCCRIQPTKVEL